jgi:hypothetical protein
VRSADNYDLHYSCFSEDYCPATDEEPSWFGEGSYSFNGNTYNLTRSFDPWEIDPECGTEGGGGEGGGRGGGGGGSGGTTYDYLPMGDTFVPPDSVPPNCNQPQLSAGGRAWCIGAPPTGTRWTRVYMALARMAEKGGICVTLANVGGALLNTDRIRLFPSTDSTAIGGAAVLGGATQAQGGTSGPNAWLVLNEFWTDQYWDFDHRSNEVGGRRRTLQLALAHELDHLVGNDHVGAGTAQVDLFTTPNQLACSDM